MSEELEEVSDVAVCDDDIDMGETLSDEEIDLFVLFPEGKDEKLEAEWKELFNG